jgi:hypothetical protein
VPYREPRAQSDVASDPRGDKPTTNFPRATGLWRVPGAHVVAVTAPPGDRVGAAVSVVTLVIR